MFFSNTSRKKKEIIAAIFDIGSGSVGAAIVRIPVDGTGLPTIIKSVRTEIATHEELDFNVFVDDMLQALSITTKAIYESKAGVPDTIACVLASPWYLSETRIIKMTQPHSFVFTRRLADELLAKEILSLKEAYKRKFTSVEGESEVIEHHVMGVSLNGYIVDEPIGKRSRSVEMHMLISVSPKVYLEKIRETLSRTFHHIPITFSSFAISSYLAVRDKYVTPDSYLLLDIGGEVTDVAIITKGVLKASLSFPFGKTTFFRYACTKLGIELRDAKELFSLYSTDTLGIRKRKKIEPLFQSAENSWGEAFRDCISALPHTLMLPDTIFLTADLDIQNWFAGVICNEPYIESMMVNRKCTVVTLNGPEFLNMCSVKDGTCDPFLMVEAIGFMRKNI